MKMAKREIDWLTDWTVLLGLGAPWGHKDAVQYKIFQVKR